MQAKTASFTIEILDQRLSRNKLYAAESRNRFGSMILADEAVVRRGLVAKVGPTHEHPGSPVMRSGRLSPKASRPPISA